MTDRDGNKFRGKISLSGLAKAKGMSSSGSTGGFPSFRFSPENEEIEEILQGDSTLAAIVLDDRQTESLPDSPKPATGDTSPIKDYLRKNWANKWDKKSLSLDLDLKEKIIAALEDKRKSIVSHFIAEETAGLIIPSSSSTSNLSCPPVVTEHTGVVTGESTISSSSTSSNNNAIVFDNATQKVSANISHSQSTGDNSSTTSEEFEEIGLDYLANMDKAEQMDDTVLDLILPFTFGADKLQDLYGDFPTLNAPTPRDDARHHKDHEFEEYEDEVEELQFKSVLKNMAASIVLHEWTKYLLALIGTAMFIPFNTFVTAVFWFMMGTIVTVIVNQSLFESHNASKSGKKEYSPSVLPDGEYSGELIIPPSPEMFQKPQKSQGWMTEFEGDYDPFSNHIRLNRVVFVRLEGSSLYISYPHSKHRIPKRRLWSDPPLASDITFTRHTVYNITGSQVFVAPERLAKRRAWNKKYPIGIRLPKYSLVSIVSPTDHIKAGQTVEANTAVPGTSSSPAVLNQPPPPVVIPQPDLTPTHKYRKGNKEIAREDVGEKVLYLFSRTDREKDDWFRRFTTAATKKDPAYGTKSTPKEDINLQKQYMTYMRTVIPAFNEFNESERKMVEQIPAPAVVQPSDKKNNAPTIPQPTDKKNNVPAVVQPSDKKNNVPAVVQPSDKKSNVPAVVQPSDKKNNPVIKKTENSGKEDTSIVSPAGAKSPAGKSPATSPTLGDTVDIERILTIPQSPVFLNALLGRIFFDFLRSPHWASQVQNLIQKKLNYIKRPQFLDVLSVRELDLGRSIPVIQRASAPVVNSQGLWIDLDITYEGNLCVTLETKLNLMKLRKSPTAPTADEEAAQPRHNVPSATGHTNLPSLATEDTGVDREVTASPPPPGPHMFDSDADDSGESSEEEEYDPEDFLVQHGHENTVTDVQPAAGKGAKILRMAEKIANSNFVTEMKVVKKAIANVANTPLVLSVELKSCVGTLALNLPSPPTDRLWFGFRTNPNMKIVAKPKFGERAVNLTHVTEWIRKKLLHEFQRVAVLPNMDDISIPLMEFKLPTS